MRKNRQRSQRLSFGLIRIASVVSKPRRLQGRRRTGTVGHSRLLQEFVGVAYWHR